MTHPIHTDNAERKHELKTDPAVFEAVARGDKTHEIRLNDRNFQVGDKLLLCETESTGAAMRSAPKLHPLVYTGRVATRIVSHIQTGYGLADGWCILSFRAAAQVGANGAADQFKRVGKCVAMKDSGIIVATAITPEWADKIVAHSLAAGAPAETPNVGFGPHARKMFEAARAFVRIANGTTDEPKPTQYFPEYRPVFGQNGKITGYTWVNAADAPKVSASGAPAETPKPDLPRSDVIEMLLDVARAAFDAMDSTEENDSGLHWDRASFDDLSATMDKLDALPDDKPGFVMGPAAKAGWAIQQGATPAATIGAGEGKDALDAARWRFLAEHAHSGGISFVDYVIHSDDVENWGATIDAAMRSKTSPGEAG